MKGLVLILAVWAGEAQAWWAMGAAAEAVECAVLLEVLENEDGSPAFPDMADVVDELNQRAMGWHGARFVETFTEQKRVYWRSEAPLDHRDADHLRAFLPKCQQWVMAIRERIR